MKKIIPVIISVIGIFILLCFSIILFGRSDKLTVDYFTEETGYFTDSVRLCMISDLHSSAFGDSQQVLIETIKEQNPDILVFTGDIFDSKRPEDPCIDLFEAVCKNYPCFFVTGNHEYLAGAEQFAYFCDILERYNIIRLSREIQTLEVNGQFFNIAGIDDPANQMYEILNNPEMEFEYQLEYLHKKNSNGLYTVLLSHRPEYLQKYLDKGVDLVLCGHAHGGQIRIPLINQGIFSPGQGLFPDYTSGEYKQDGITMIVSRGLALDTEIIPRLYNKPELVIIDLI